MRYTQLPHFIRATWLRLQWSASATSPNVTGDPKVIIRVTKGGVFIDKTAVPVEAFEMVSFTSSL